MSSNRFSPGNHVVDIPSLFAAVFDALVALMLSELDRIQYKVGFAVQVNESKTMSNVSRFACNIAKKSRVPHTQCLSTNQVQMSKDDGSVSKPFFRSRQKMILNEDNISLAVQQAQAEITKHLDSWVSCSMSLFSCELSQLFIHPNFSYTYTFELTTIYPKRTYQYQT